MNRRLFIAVSVAAAAVPALAFDPSLVHRLLSDDAGVRGPAYAEAAALSTGDKRNLAPALAGRLEDPALGERAAIALCRLAGPGVPFLERHARAPYPGGEFAYMGLLMNADGGWSAAANVLRNGDPAAILRALEVIGVSKLLPPDVKTEVGRLSADADRRVREAAAAAMAAVSPDAGGAAWPKADSPAPFADDAALAEFIRAAEESAVSPMPSPSPPAPAGNKFDGSGYRTRQPASSLFRKNAQP